MKITCMESFFVKPRWHFLKISTDEGLVGWGEPIVESRAQTVAKAVEELGRILIGEDPRRIEYLYQAMYRISFYRGGPVLTSAISGVEQALWDIKGKYYNMPVYEMLGGSVRDAIRMYAHVRGNTPEALAQSVTERREQGFTAVKTSFGGPLRPLERPAFFAHCSAKMAAARQAAGDEMDIALDFHGRVNPHMAVKLINALEDYHPMFIEEPCTPENPAMLAEIARKTAVPIASGERLFTRFGFREALESYALAVVQPDLCHCGGILEAKKIAAMAETYYASLAPHNPLGPISLAACLQVDACTQNFLCQEYPSMPDEWDLGSGYLKEPFVVDNGYIAIPQGPGLGIEVDEDVVRERACAGDWDSPRLFLDDGTVAEW